MGPRAPGRRGGVLAPGGPVCDTPGPAPIGVFASVGRAGLEDARSSRDVAPAWRQGKLPQEALSHMHHVSLGALAAWAGVGLGGRAGSGVLRARAVPEMAREWPGVGFPGRGKEGLHALLERGCVGEGSREDPSVWGAGALAKGWETPSVTGGICCAHSPFGCWP